MRAAKIRNRLTAAVVMILMFVAATAASHREQSRVEGTWTGESICQVKSSPCHDEKAIYVVSKPDAAGKVTIDMGKIVEGKPETMGVLVFTYDMAAGTLVCDHRGVWKLKVMGDEMKGTLTLHDGTLYRRMRLKRAKS